MDRKLGPISNLLGMLPGAAQNRDLLSQISDKDLDRAAAIVRALELARPGDVVVIAGKGAEQGQEPAAPTIPFDDREAARAALRERMPQERDAVLREAARRRIEWILRSAWELKPETVAFWNALVSA